MEQEKKRNISFLLFMGLFAFAADFLWFGIYINNFNFSWYGLDYDGGFAPAGLLGAIVKFFVNLSGTAGEVTAKYGQIYFWNKVMLFLSYVLYILFFAMVLYVVRKRKPERLNLTRWLMIITAVFAFPMFCDSPTFGGAEFYKTLIVLLCLICFFNNWLRWFIVPLCMLGVCISPDFVIRNWPLVLLVLATDILFGKNKHRIFMIFVNVLAVLLTLFVSELSAQAITDSYIENRFAYTDVLSGEKTFEYDDFLRVIDHMSLFNISHEGLLQGVICLVMLAVFFLPYEILLVRFLRRIFQNHKAYVFMFLLCLIPIWVTIFLYDEYGLSCFNMTLYVVVGVLFAVVRGPKDVWAALEEIFSELKAKYSAPVEYILCVYPLLFMPFQDQDVCNTVGMIYKTIIGLV